MQSMAKKLLNLDQCAYQPKHTNNLANEFKCYANYNLDHNLWHLGKILFFGNKILYASTTIPFWSFAIYKWIKLTQLEAIAWHFNSKHQTTVAICIFFKKKKKCNALCTHILKPKMHHFRGKQSTFVYIPLCILTFSSFRKKPFILPQRQSLKMFSNSTVRKFENIRQILDTLASFVFTTHEFFHLLIMPCFWMAKISAFHIWVSTFQP